MLNTFWKGAVMAAMLAVPRTSAQAGWGSVSVSVSPNNAVLENSKIRVRYADRGGGAETPITEFIIKGVNEDQGGSFLDACATRGGLTHAEVIEDSDTAKGVRLEWDDGAMVQHVFIFPDKPYIRIDYLAYGVNIVDIGSPGGGTGRYTFYGGDTWKRDYVLYEKCYYYPDSDAWCVEKTGMAGDDGPGPLDYNGWFIMGITDTNNRGYGRIMPVRETTIMKLLFSKGFELFPCFSEPHRPFSSYLYAVTDGPREVISMGQALTREPAPDMAYPEIDTAFAMGERQVRVIFNEPVTAATGGTPATFGISRGIGVSAAVLSPDRTMADLTLGASMQEGVRYKVSAEGIEDDARNGGRTIAYFYYGNGTGIFDSRGHTESLAAGRVQIRPNPVRPGQQVRFSGCGNAGTVSRLDILDSRGGVVRSLRARPGTVTWDGKNRSGQAVSEGIYYARPYPYGKTAAFIITR